ncbi:MAG TPA: mannose-6-phosphate isomerase [Flavobacteriia bacterium]|nr:mannose-6-phosphate isomerase [Flavobacteriia bacterium]
MIKAPIKFNPILQEKIWGGTKLLDVLHKKSAVQSNTIGESWEISTVENAVSVVAEGAYQGKTLLDLVKQFPKDLLGEKVVKQFPNEFPLLIKYIDAKQDLSVQLHPNDALAKKRHNSYGKTEMWYVIQADKDAKIIVGFKEKVDTKTYKKYLEEGKILDILNTEKAQKGDVYFIPTGRVHAIGAGVLLAEIQQTSDITYRIYDWERKDKDGNSRDLHTNEALDALDFKVYDSYKTSYSVKENESQKIVECGYFTTEIISVIGSVKKDFTKRDSFTIFMNVSGAAEIRYDNQKMSVNYGETVLIPNCLNHLEIVSTNKAELLEVYI